MTKDLNKEIVTLSYNSLNLPDTLQLKDGHMVSYVYDASGRKEQVNRVTMITSGITVPVGRTLNNANLGNVSTSYSYTKYASNVVYNNTHISSILLPDGIMIRTNALTTNPPVFSYNHYIRDHLGNIRTVIDNSGVIKQVNNYYPFGMEYGESAETQSQLTYQDYLFGGKEFDRKFEVNLYDFGARFYDATRGQWTTPDPLAEKHYSISPYAYCANNPMKFVDPDGMDYYGLDENTKRLSLVQSNKDKTDFVQSGSYDKDDKFIANDKNNSIIMLSKGVLNAKNSQQDLSKEGFVTKGGNQKDGVDLLCFISNQTGVEVAAKGFSTNEGREELLMGRWNENTEKESCSPEFNQEGTVMFDVHTHFIGKDNNPGLGFGVASRNDFKTKTDYSAYYIISQRNGLTQYFPAPGRGTTYEERQKYTVYPSISTVPNSLKSYLNPR